MFWIVVIVLALGAHFSLTAIAPGQAGKAAFYWPFAKDSQPMIAVLGGAAQTVTMLLSGIAGLCFLAGILALFGWLVPAGWLPALIAVGAIASALLYLLYFGVNALIPLAIDAFLLLGVFNLHWTVASLK